MSDFVEANGFSGSSGVLADVLQTKMLLVQALWAIVEGATPEALAVLIASGFPGSDLVSRPGDFGEMQEHIDLLLSLIDDLAV